MRSRFMMELTTPEIEAYFKEGGDIAVLPIGTVEMHGPHQPTGTDTFLAKAFALRLAEDANGLVMPEINYSWTGSTDGFAGTISIDVTTEITLVEMIVQKIIKMGFKRIVLMNAHGPNDPILFLCARRIFEKEQVPVLFMDPFHPFSEDIGKIFANEYEMSKEASMVLGALHILGRSDLYTEKEMSYEEEAPIFPDSYNRLSPIGTIGYFMQDTRQHACPSNYVSLEKGLEFINKQVERMLLAMEDLTEYIADASGQRNKGSGYAGYGSGNGI